MRKIIVSELITLDGFFSGQNGEINWHIVDEEYNQYAIDLLNTADTILLGRVTYQLFENYWPALDNKPSASKSELEIAHMINNMTKIVFSGDLEEVTMKNAALLKKIDPQEILKMKQKPGKDMVIFGSGSIVSAFTRHGLIDEYQFVVNPVVIGRGRTLFKDIQRMINFRLLRTMRFSSGNILLVYQPASSCRSDAPPCPMPLNPEQPASQNQ